MCGRGAGDVWEMGGDVWERSGRCAGEERERSGRGAERGGQRTARSAARKASSYEAEENLTGAPVTPLHYFEATGTSLRARATKHSGPHTLPGSGRCEWEGFGGRGDASGCTKLTSAFILKPHLSHSVSSSRYRSVSGVRAASLGAWSACMGCMGCIHVCTEACRSFLSSPSCTHAAVHT